MRRRRTLRWEVEEQQREREEAEWFRDRRGAIGRARPCTRDGFQSSQCNHIA